MSLLEACSTRDVVFVESREGDASAFLDGGTPTWNVPDAAVDAAGDATVRPSNDGGNATDGRCSVDGSVPVLNLGDGGCVGDLAARAFRYALCVCEDAVFNAGLASAVSGTVGTDAGASASVGINGNLVTASRSTIHGSLWTRSGISSASDLAVDGELHCASNLSGAGSASVRSDAWIGGNIDLGTFSVSGTLTQPASANNRASIRAGARVFGAVAAVAPCDCDPAQRLPITALIQGLAAANDNAAAQFSSQAFASVLSGQTLELPCGKLYATALHSAAPLTLRVSAQTVLAVTGDLDLGGDFTIEMTTPSASLDLLVGGTIRSKSRVRLGSAARPSALRIYVAGDTNLDTSALWELHGNLYAPTAIVNTSGGALFDGSLFVRSINASAPVVFGYDKGILSISDGCGPPTGCTDCRDCRGQACTLGRCASCTDSSECCAPLVCVNGSCVPEAPLR